MTSWGHIARQVAARTPHPLAFLRNSDRSDRPDRPLLGPKELNRGLGEIARYQDVKAQMGRAGSERPEMRGNARARVKPGSGGERQVCWLHALLCISGPSDPSGRDPPSPTIVFNGLRSGVERQSQALLLFFRPFEPSLKSTKTISRIESVKKNKIWERAGK